MDMEKFHLGVSILVRSNDDQAYVGFPYVKNSDDCNNFDGDIYPYATDIESGVDQDCNGLILVARRQIVI